MYSPFFAKGISYHSEGTQHPNLLLSFPLPLWERIKVRGIKPKAGQKLTLFTNQCLIIALS